MQRGKIPKETTTTSEEIATRVNPLYCQGLIILTNKRREYHLERLELLCSLILTWSNSLTNLTGRGAAQISLRPARFSLGGSWRLGATEILIWSGSDRSHLGLLDSQSDLEAVGADK